VSESYTIEAVGEALEWESAKYKKRYLGYPLDLRDANGHLHAGVESNRQLKEDGSHNEPKVGEVVIGSIAPDHNGNDKLTLDYNAMKEGSSSGSADYKPRANTPAQDPIGVQWAIGRANEQYIAGLLKGEQIEESAKRLLAMRDRLTGSALQEAFNANPPPELDPEDIPFRRPEYREPFTERLRWRL